MAGGPGRIPAQLIAHILFFFSKLGHLIFDPTRMYFPTAENLLNAEKAFHEYFGLLWAKIKP